MLTDIADKYYLENNYNCAETIIRAGNDYYNLGLHDHDMIMVGGFGAGMQTGNTCGAVLSGVSILSMKYIEAKAHESGDIKPAVQILMRKFKELYGSTLCKDIKAQRFTKEARCRQTILDSCEIIEKAIAEYEAERAK